VVIARDLLDRVIAHARREFPNECCGLVAARDGTAVSVHELENVAASPLRFEVDGMALHHELEGIEDGGGRLAAIYHSHTRTDPYPSQTDLNFATGWPGVEWLIVGLRAGDSDPVVRSYRIDDGRPTEVGLEVGDGD
jgi:[CysO sulfur-carrier protein]-S-L-cysteine hydrolase